MRPRDAMEGDTREITRVMLVELMHRLERDPQLRPRLSRPVLPIAAPAFPEEHDGMKTAAKGRARSSTMNTAEDAFGMARKRAGEGRHWGAVAAIATISAVGVAVGLSFPLLSFLMEQRGYSTTLIGANTAMAGIASMLAVPVRQSAGASHRARGDIGAGGGDQRGEPDGLLLLSFHWRVVRASHQLSTAR